VTLMALLDCDTIVELVRYAEYQNKEDEQLKDSLISCTNLLFGLTQKLCKKRLIEFVDAYHTKFPGGPLTPPPSGEKGAAKVLMQTAQKFQERARVAYTAFPLGKRLEDAFPRSTRDSCQINIASLVKQALILGLSGSAECVLKELGTHLKKHLDNVKGDFRTINGTSKQERQEFYQRSERLTRNIRFFESPKEKHLKAFKSIWASHSPATLPPSAYLARLAPPVPTATPVEFTQDDFNTKFAERVMIVEGCGRQALVIAMPRMYFYMLQYARRSLYHRCEVARDSPDARLMYSTQNRTGPVCSNPDRRTACPLHDHGMTEADLLDETKYIAQHLSKEKRKQMLMNYLNTKLNITTLLGTQPDFKVQRYYTDEHGQTKSKRSSRVWPGIKKKVLAQVTRV